MGWFDDVVDFVEDTASSAIDVVGDGLDALGSVASDGVEFVGDGISSGYDVIDDFATEMDYQFGITDTFSDVGEVGEFLFDEIIDPTLTALEDVGFFEVIELATFTLVDIEYSDQGLSVNYGIEDVFGFGVSIGEHGIAADSDAFGGGFDIAYGSKDGFSAGASVGWDWGPLPNASAHVSVDEAGDFGVGGRGEGYLPSPSGFSGGELEVDYQETPEGFRVDASMTGRHFAPSGTYAGAGVHVGYEEDDEGYRTNVGVHAELGQLGGPEVRTSVDYVEGRRGDAEFSGVEVSAEAEVAGAEAEASVSYTHVETPDGDFDIVTGSSRVSAAGVEASGSATIESGDDGVSFTADGDVDTDVDPLAAGQSLADAAGVDVPDVPDVPELPDIPAPDDAFSTVRDTAAERAEAAVDDALAEATETVEDL